MAAPVRIAIAWLLACGISFQGLTALYLEWLGPLHFHLETHDELHAHSHSQPERHHHARDHGVVVVHEHEHHQPPLHDSETASGWSGVKMLALPHEVASPPVTSLSRTPHRTAVLAWPSLIGKRLERPPRVSLV